MAAIDDGEDVEPGGLLRWREEAAAQSLATWSPVLLALGIWSYFALPREPPLWIFAAFTAGIAALVVLRRRGGNRVTLLVALLLSGFVLAKARTEWVATSLLHATTDKTKITGVVESISFRGPRLATIKLKTENPRYLRLSYSGKTRPRPGDVIEAEAYLAPLPVPVVPGGFDFGRALYFEGVGGTGRIMGDATIRQGPPGFAYWLRAGISNLRAAIGARIAAALPKDLRGFAEALVTGERGQIPRDVNQSLQASGLFHILSISGLHMSLVAGGVFWIIRALLALFPAIAERWPIKKWAAAAALVAGLLYMMLAGADVATQRSYIMIAVMFFAVLIDRPALSMRNLSMAALIILVTQPESAVNAGFQMSFMAVAGLVAFYEAYARWRSERFENVEAGLIIRALGKTANAVFAMAITTLVAGTLSSIPAVYHFGRLAPLSLLGNLLALPIVSLLVMPAALLAVLLMPFGLEGLPLFVLGEGLKLVMRVSDWVAALPGARLALAPPSMLSALAMSAAAIWVCLWRGRARWAGLSFLALLAIPAAPPPDIFIEATAVNVAIRLEDGTLVPADPKKGRFALEKWLLANGEDVAPKDAAKRGGWACAASACKAMVKGKRVVYLQDGATPDAHCRDADILIAAFPLRGACRVVAHRIDRFDVWRNGAYAIHISREVDMNTSRGEQGERPWVVTPEARKK